MAKYFPIFVFVFLCFAASVPALALTMPHPGTIKCRHIGGEVLKEGTEYYCSVQHGEYVCPLEELATEDTCDGLRICKENSDCSENEFCSKKGCGGYGVCATRPQYCIQVYDPVCGCDGKTYGNRCAAHAEGTNVAYDGECLPRKIGLSVEKGCGGKVSLSWRSEVPLASAVIFYAPWPEMEPINSFPVDTGSHGGTFRATLPIGTALYVAVGGLTEEGELVISNIEHFTIIPDFFPCGSEFGSEEVR